MPRLKQFTRYYGDFMNVADLRVALTGVPADTLVQIRFEVDGGHAGVDDFDSDAGSVQYDADENTLTIVEAQ